MEARIAALETRQNILCEQMEKLAEQTESVHNLTESVAKMATTLEYMQKDLGNVDSRLAEIEKKPALRWDKLVGQLISMVSGALITYLLTQAGII